MDLRRTLNVYRSIYVKIFQRNLSNQETYLLSYCHVYVATMTVSEQKQGFFLKKRAGLIRFFPRI